MKTIALKLVIVTLCVTVVGLALGTTGDDETLSQIAGYRNWTRVTSKPLAIAIDLSSVAG
jgi:succinate-acetate transporter protein